MSWMQTATGRRVDFLNPDPKQIDLRDVARALGGNCRYVGGTTKHYSVAEHSNRISRFLFRDYAAAIEDVHFGRDRNARLLAIEQERDARLLTMGTILSAHFHDAPEAYMGDPPYPLKQAMPEIVRHWYDGVEVRLGTAMEVAFGLSPGMITSPPDVVKRLDASIVVSEREQLLNASGEENFDGWFTPAEGVGFDWLPAECWDRDTAADIWLTHAREYLALWSDLTPRRDLK